MANLDPIALLSLIIALSAYVGGVRLAVLGRIAAIPPPSNRHGLKSFLKWLVPADATLATSALLLLLKVFWGDLFGGSAPSWFDPTIIWTFFVGVIVLVCHHIVSWYKSFFA